MSAQRPTVALEVAVEDLHHRAMTCLHEEMYAVLLAGGLPELGMVAVVRSALGNHAAEQFEEWAAR